MDFKRDTSPVDRSFLAMSLRMGDALDEQTEGGGVAGSLAPLLDLLLLP